jgi:hypothetical protein
MEDRSEEPPLPSSPRGGASPASLPSSPRGGTPPQGLGCRLRRSCVQAGLSQE